MKKLITRLYDLMFKSGISGRKWRLFNREFRLYKQRLTKGWDDSETWGLFNTTSEFLVPRLKRFYELNNSHPGDLTSREWDEIIDKMIEAFEIIAEDDIVIDDKRQAKVEEGLQLFAKWFQHLWW